MLKLRRHAPGTAPATLVTSETLAVPAVITLIEYDATGIDERKVERVEDIFVCKTNGKISWINIDGVCDGEMLRKIGTHFGLHPLALEDVQNIGQRPKIEEYADHFFIVTKMVYCDGKKDVSFEHVSMFLGKDFLITFQEEGTRDVFDPVRTRLRNARGFARTMGHDYLAYALLDSIVDHFFPVLEDIGEMIEELEDELLVHPTRECVGRLHDLKRTLLQLRRAAWPERELVNTMSRDESGLVSHETKLFLRDCYDHTIQIMDVIESYRDLTAGMMDLYLSSLGMRTNEIMRVLTVVTTIFIPLTFIAGIYGMNFDTAASPYNMPELKHPYGYPICVAVMALIAVAMLAFFRRKKWL
ncbi:MAG: magnesium transporter [Chthoniobacter sp.]|nr:magnesium transporter [Chthoniobacter sp.]